MLVMIEPSQIKTNEIAKVKRDAITQSNGLPLTLCLQDAYNECVQLKEFLSEQLWSEVDDDGISSVQSALDDLNQALGKYEMTNDMIEGEW